MCCSGKAGFTFSFNNGKVIDYQDHYKMLFFFYAKMFVVSYSIIVTFHPDLSLPRINIFRSYDQSYSLLMSLAHFFVLDFHVFNDPDIFNKNTLKQLEAAALSVKQKEKNTALAEMFSVELKFSIDCLKSWFQKNHKISEIDLDQKLDFIRKNPVKDSLCCLCDFPIDPKVANGW